MPDRHSAEVQLANVAELARGVLGDSLLGLYLAGSAARDALRPDSDLDILAVLRQPTTRGQRVELTGGLLRLSGRGDPSGLARSVDFTAVVGADVRPWRFPPPMDFQFGDWWRSELAAGSEPWRSPNPDLAILLAEALVAGRPLIGPPPAAYLDPVPRTDLRAASVAAIDGLLEDLRPDTRNVLLTLARIWTTVETGEIRSKDAAADWAIARLPASDGAVLATARDGYLMGLGESWDDQAPAVEACASRMAGAIRDAAGSS